MPLAIANLRKLKGHYLHSRLAAYYLQLKMWEKAAGEIEKAYTSREVSLGVLFIDHPARRLCQPSSTKKSF